MWCGEDYPPTSTCGWGRIKETESALYSQYSGERKQSNQTRAPELREQRCVARQEDAVANIATARTIGRRDFEDRWRERERGSIRSGSSVGEKLVCFFLFHERGGREEGDKVGTHVRRKTCVCTTLTNVAGEDSEQCRYKEVRAAHAFHAKQRRIEKTSLD